MSRRRDKECPIRAEQQAAFRTPGDSSPLTVTSVLESNQFLPFLGLATASRPFPSRPALGASEEITYALVAPSWFETRSEIGSKIYTENCCIIRVHSWTGDRDEVHFEPLKLAVRNLESEISCHRRQMRWQHACCVQAIPRRPRAHPGLLMAVCLYPPSSPHTPSTPHTPSSLVYYFRQRSSLCAGARPSSPCPQEAIHRVTIPPSQPSAPPSPWLLPLVPRNERAGETGDTRENPPTNSIVRHDSYTRKSGVTRPGIEPGSPWWEASRLTVWKNSLILRLLHCRAYDYVVCVERIDREMFSDAGVCYAMLVHLLADNSRSSNVIQVLRDSCQGLTAAEFPQEGNFDVDCTTPSNFRPLDQVSGNCVTRRHRFGVRAHQGKQFSSLAIDGAALKRRTAETYHAEAATMPADSLLASKAHLMSAAEYPTCFSPQARQDISWSSRASKASILLLGSVIKTLVLKRCDVIEMEARHVVIEDRSSKGVGKVSVRIPIVTVIIPPSPRARLVFYFRVGLRSPGARLPTELFCWRRKALSSSSSTVVPKKGRRGVDKKKTWALPPLSPFLIWMLRVALWISRRPHCAYLQHLRAIVPELEYPS
ncbi:hypothetical protein PR048_028635 [Dryococelus australis]|uniref:Uncharacterized protein n=1 Tax=Dryococelus australis TaxID=614101 RepID=A0ABQ9GBT2_9NEOP|nr:hypothetical protein PR048_028635 [Dryococelus australis]